MLKLINIHNTTVTRNIGKTLKTYIENTKRELSDKLNDKDEQKKAKEGYLDLSLNQDEADDFFLKVLTLQDGHQYYMNFQETSTEKSTKCSEAEENDAQIKDTQQLKEANDANEKI